MARMASQDLNGNLPSDSVLKKTLSVFGLSCKTLLQIIIINPLRGCPPTNVLYKIIPRPSSTKKNTPMYVSIYVVKRN